MPPCSTVVHFISRQSLVFDIIVYFVQPSSPRSSSLPSLINFHFLPSYAVLLPSDHMSTPTSFLDFLCDFPHFLCPAYSFISDLVQLRNTAHPSQHSHLCDLQFIFLCLLQCPCLCPVHQCWSYHCSVHLPLDLHVHSPAHNTPDTLFPFFQPFCTLWGLLRPVLHPPPKSIPDISHQYCYNYILT